MTDAALLERYGVPLPGQYATDSSNGTGPIDWATLGPPLSSLSLDPPPPYLAGWLDAEGHTILFGTGGAYKGTIASWWAVMLARAGHRPLVVDYEAHPNEWARRIGKLGGRDVLDATFIVSPTAREWPAARGALWEHAEAIRTIADARDADVLIIDSIVPACGGTDALDSQAAGQYAAGLALIDRPALSLAHTTKLEDSRYPFGSVFWHNLARTTWHVEKMVEGTCVLTHRKHNNAPSMGKFMLTITYADDLPAEVWERSYTAALADRIEDALGAESLTVAEIVERLGDENGERVKADSVRAALRRGLKAQPRTFTLADDRWAVA